jgi:hypothetical protein
MTPDYAHKIFTDKRTNYNLLMEELAMDGFFSASSIAQSIT